jgi:hypothetical protein
MRTYGNYKNKKKYKNYFNPCWIYFNIWIVIIISLSFMLFFSLRFLFYYYDAFFSQVYH